MKNLKSAINAYTPISLVMEKQHEAFQILHQALKNPSLPEAAFVEILDNIISFAYEKEDVHTVVSWLNSKEFPLERDHQNLIMLAVCKS